MIEIWNEIVEAGIAFSQEKQLTLKTAVAAAIRQCKLCRKTGERVVDSLEQCRCQNQGQCNSFVRKIRLRPHQTTRKDFS